MWEIGVNNRHTMFFPGVTLCQILWTLRGRCNDDETWTMNIEHWTRTTETRNTIYSEFLHSNYLQLIHISIRLSCVLILCRYIFSISASSNPEALFFYYYHFFHPYSGMTFRSFIALLLTHGCVVWLFLFSGCFFFPSRIRNRTALQISFWCHSFTMCNVSYRIVGYLCLRSFFIAFPFLCVLFFVFFFIHLYIVLVFFVFL